MAKPRRFNWQPTENYEPAERVGRDLFDAGLPLGDIPKVKKPAAAAARVMFPSKPLGCECGNPNYIQIGKRWVCDNCRPRATKPQQRTAAREIVTIPASLANDAAELRKAWELMQQKRAAAGLDRLAEICEPTQPEPQPVEWPESVSFYSHMGIGAARRLSKLGGGWRLYVMAKALDPQGLGKIARDDLRAYALFLGVEVRTFQRWMNQARNAGLFYTDVQNSSGQWMIVMANAGIAAAELNCETVGRKVTLPVAELIGNGWKARVWAAYEITHNGQPIARETMQKIVNVPVSTQRYRDGQAKVKRIKNFATSEVKVNNGQLRGMKDTSGRKNIFIDKDGNLSWRLPNSYQYIKALRGGKGRGRVANKIINNIQSANGLLLLQQALSLQDEYNKDLVKLFNQNPQQAKKNMRKLAKIDNRKVKEIYERSHTTHSRAVIWKHCPVNPPVAVIE